MNAHELGHAKVEYYDKATERMNEVSIYFRYLPRKGDSLTVYTREGRTISGWVHSVDHHVEDQRRIEADITIKLDSINIT